MQCKTSGTRFLSRKYSVQRIYLHCKIQAHVIHLVLAVRKLVHRYSVNHIKNSVRIPKANDVRIGIRNIKVIDFFITYKAFNLISVFFAIIITDNGLDNAVETVLPSADIPLAIDAPKDTSFSFDYTPFPHPPQLNSFFNIEALIFKCFL